MVSVDFGRYFPVEFEWLYFSVGPVEPEIWSKKKSKRIDVKNGKIDIENH